MDRWIFCVISIWKRRSKSRETGGISSLWQVKIRWSCQNGRVSNFNKREKNVGKSLIREKLERCGERNSLPLIAHNSLGYIYSNNKGLLSPTPFFYFFDVSLKCPGASFLLSFWQCVSDLLELSDCWGGKRTRKRWTLFFFFFFRSTARFYSEGGRKDKWFYPQPFTSAKMDNFFKFSFRKFPPPLLLLLLLSSSSVGREIFDLKFYRKYQRKLGSFTCKLKCDSEIREVSRWNTEETKCVFCFFYRRRISDEL